MINKVILIGNVGSDPEIKTLPNGNRVANLSLATTESWKDKEGNKNDKTEWHRIVTFRDPIINIIEQYVKKGSKLYIEGSLKTRKYSDSNGVEKYSTEIILQNFSDQLKMLDSRNSNSGPSSYNNNDSEKEEKSNDKNKSQDSSFNDDDIPF